MNKLMTLTLLIAFWCGTANADNTKYIKTMEKTLTMVDTAKTQGSYQTIANKLDRIAGVEKGEWLPKYWGSFCYVVMGYMEKDKNKIDLLLDKAWELIEQAEAIQKDESEIYVMKGWIYSARIGVDPMTRGMKYGPLSDQMQQKAKELNPKNPRPYYMLGTGKFYTPAMFGGGKDKAEPLLEEALKRYTKFKKASAIHPDWGKEETEKMLKQCKAEEE
jgi:hypothetical protein